MPLPTGDGYARQKASAPAYATTAIGLKTAKLSCKLTAISN